MVFVTTFFACSTDNSVENDFSNKEFFEVEIFGETYKKDWYGGSIGRENQCNSESDLQYTMTLNIETSKFSFDADYLIPVYVSDWDNNAKPESEISVFGDGFEPCYKPFDFVVSLRIRYDNVWYGAEIVNSASNYNDIREIVLYEEDSQEKYYYIHGNFEVTVKGKSGEIIPMKGKYSYPISITK